jgi:Sas10/Utp3/C1D family
MAVIAHATAAAAQQEQALPPVSDSVSFLAVKQQLLLSYCLDLSVYLGRKLKGQSIAEHPATWQLLELRTLLEKLRPLDSKLKYQTDKLLRLATTGAAAPESDPLSFRPNPEALVCVYFLCITSYLLTVSVSAVTMVNALAADQIARVHAITCVQLQHQQ